VSKARILIVDDEEAIREVVSNLLESKGYQCFAVENGQKGAEYVQQNPVDLVMSDMMMPVMGGLDLLQVIRATDRDLPPVIMVTATHDVSKALEAIRGGAYDYILKPFEKDQLFLAVQRALDHGKVLLENRNYQRNLEHLVGQRTSELKYAMVQLEQSYDATLEALGGALDLKDSETVGHCKRVTAFTIAIAKAMGLDPDMLPEIARAAFLHDIGKMAIPDRILQKPGPLTDEERAIMRAHCDIGYNMLVRIPFLRHAAEIVLAHQEFYDGSGYPRGLRGETIPLGARIFAIADAVDAMTSDRPYRKALSVEHARREVQRCSGTQFDPKVVEVFLSLPDSLWAELRENAQAPFHLAVSGVLV
jgi:putative nucleotidyltransferase with HDIG domain